MKDIDEEDIEKLKNSLVENDFVMPFHIWEETEVDRWILDADHREKALKELEAEGADVPGLLPATFIECADKKATAKLFLIYSSIYAKITNEGLRSYIIDVNSFAIQ